MYLASGWSEMKSRRNRIRDAGSLSHTEQAAMVLMSMERGQAVAVLRELPPGQVQRLGAAMLAMDDYGRGVASQVVQQFLIDVDQASSVRSFNREDLRDMLDEALGRERGRLLGERLSALRADSQLAKLRWLDSHSIAVIMDDEHPQIQTVLLACLGPEQASQVLLALPASRRHDLLARLASLETVSSLALEELEAVLASHFDGNAGALRQQLKLKQMSVQQESALLQALGILDPDRAARIEAMMFEFADLQSLRKEDLAKLLAPLALDLLARAISDVPHAMRSDILAALTKERRRELSKELRKLSPAARMVAEDARSEVLRVARKMADLGEIVIDSRRAVAD
jgi:flagellar motor switch protein FliG